MDLVRRAGQSEFEHVLKPEEPRFDTHLNIVRGFDNHRRARLLLHDVDQSCPCLFGVVREFQWLDEVSGSGVLTADAVWRVRAGPQLAFDEFGIFLIGHVAHRQFWRKGLSHRGHRDHGAGHKKFSLRPLSSLWLNLVAT